MLKVNEYFDGNVKSIGFANSEGRITAGVMEVGEYEFGTSENELIRVVSGCMNIQLPDADGFRAFKPGDEFSVAANKKFQVRIEEQSAYLCYYT